MTDPSTPPHLIPLRGHDDWALWRIVGVRGAGFPARLSHELGSERVARAARARLDAEEALRERFEAVDQAIGRALDRLPELDADARRATLKAAKLVRKGRVDEERVRDLLGAELVDAWAAARAALAEAEEMARAAYDEGVEEQSRRLAEIAGDAQLNRAVLWQNRGAWARTFRRLTRYEPGARNSKQREQEEFLANYIARYSVKNDTIGFFGPMGWGRLHEGDGAVRAEPGPKVVASREVFVEHWALLEIAKTLRSQRTVRRHLPVRRTPHYRLAGDDIVLPHARFPVSPQFKAILLAVREGTTPAADTAQALLEGELFRDEDDVFDHVEQLVGMKVLTWDFHVPCMPQATEDLLRQVDALPPAVRDELRGRLAPFLAALEALKALDAPPPADLEVCLAAVENAYLELTGAAQATRDGGFTYAGRTVVFEDCVRDLDLSVGRAVVDELAPTLGLVGQSLRWLSTQAVAQVRETLDGLFDDLAAEHDEVDAATYQLRLLRSADALTAKIASLHQEYKDKWARILELDEGASRQRVTEDAVAAGVAEAFPATSFGWADAMHHNPDIMIAAESLEAIEAGDYELVLGEVHPGAVTILTWGFQHLCPLRDEVFDAQNADMAGHRAAITRTTVVGPTACRLQPAWLAPPESTLIAPLEPLASTRDEATLLSDYVVERVEGELTLRLRGSEARFPVIDTLGMLFSRLLVEGFGLLDLEGHRPRVTMGRMVLCREAWRVPATDLAMAELDDRAEAYHRFLRFARERGLPRFTFYRLPRALENKPMYLDTDSPISVSIFLGAVRRCLASDLPKEDKSMVITEMLPRATQTWLTDADGERYTAELRMTMLDQAPRDAQPRES